MVRAWFIVALAIALAGCASSEPAAQPDSSGGPWPATQPDARADLPIDHVVPTTLPTTQPGTGRASADALVWYARGQDDLLRHRPFDAMDDFRQALKADPNSFDNYYAMGLACIGAYRHSTGESFDAFEHAATLRPDDLKIHLLIARQYETANNADAALRHFCLATLTSGYRAGAAGAATVDLYLAQLLDQLGYDRAALEIYQRLAVRLENPNTDFQGDPEVAFLVGQPQAVLLQVAQIYERHEQYAAALTNFKAVADYDPANFHFSAKVVEMLSLLGRQDEATYSAAGVIRRFRASGESLALLHEISERIGTDREIGVLRRLQREDPSQLAIAYALADVLAGAGRIDDAAQTLQDAHGRNPGDMALVRHMFDFYSDHGDTKSAAQLIVTQLAAQPDSVRELNELFMQLIRPQQANALRMKDLQKIDVPRSAEAARLYLVARTASLWRRDALARSSVDRAVRLNPPFVPAYRMEVETIWDRPELSVDQKHAAVAALQKTAAAAGNASLAAEVAGLSFILEGKFPEALAALQQAISLGGTSPDLRFTYAAALRHEGQGLQCEQVLWKLVTERPLYEEAWDSLHEYYVAAGQDDDAQHVLYEWLRADPGSPIARLYEAQWDIRNGRAPSGQDQLVHLLQDHADNERVLRDSAALFAEMGQGDQFLKILEALRQRQPTNFTLIEFLVEIYTRAGETDSALAILDETHKAVAQDPDLLYQLAALYHQINHEGDWEKLLLEVLAEDAQNVPANNDLGFAWADEGKNLDRAESLIRRAVAAEPDNQAFLDSLGWVLYKRGRFAEAADAFQQAIGPAALPDPEILDHFGDDLYRLGKTDDAQKQWERSLQELHARNADSSDDPTLPDRVQRKLQDAQAAKPVNVAPIAK